MGGIGSGRHGHSHGKSTTCDYRAIDVRRWQRDGLLVPNQAFGWQWLLNDEVIASIRVRTEPNQITLTYRHKVIGHEWKEEAYSVFLDWSACNFGGKRPWFLCPINGCDNRVAILYGHGIFACRHCYQLAYSSQRETYYDRAARRTNKIRSRLGWKQGILNFGGRDKPKGMHWKTFEHLNKKHDLYMSLSIAGIAAQLNL